MTADEAAKWLRDRANSYGRDAAKLRAEDAPVNASAAYETVRDELREAARLLRAQ